MPSQQQQRRQSQERAQEPAEEITVPAPADLSATDALLDEIDAALSGLDTELVTEFRQKGGQ